MAGRQRDNTFPMRVQEPAGTHEQRAGPTCDGGCKGGLDLAFARGIEHDEWPTHRPRGGLHVRSLLDVGIIRVHQHRDGRRLGHQLAQQLESVRPHGGAEKDDARDIAARPVEAGDEAQRDGVAPVRKDDRHRRGCGLGRERRNSIADDDGHGPADQFSDQRRQSIGAVVRIAIFDCDVLSLDEPCFFHALATGGRQVLERRQRGAAETPDHRHRRLLRARRQRPRNRRRRRRAAEQGDELAAAHYSMTSSARASSIGGTVRPSALAVLRLITN